MNTKTKIKLKWIGLSACSGILAGLAVALFFFLLNSANNFRDHHPAIIWLLPLAGFAIGWLYYQSGKDIVRGNNLILEEIHDPKKFTPLKMTPFILLGTVVTHLFGGSAGREGTAVQMGASLSDQLAKFFSISMEDRKILLVTGIGAGFSAAIGTPWAGVVFGMEVLNTGRLKLFAVLECIVASFCAFFTIKLLHVPHSVFPSIAMPTFLWRNLLWVALAGILFGLTAKLFSLLTHFIEKLHNRFVSYPPMKPMIGGALLLFFYYLEGSYHYIGLGISLIQKALIEPAHFELPLYKTFFTALTIGSGFKGGEFIPLVFIGSTMGSALALILPVSFQLLSALGFAAVFAGAANTPIACTIMAMEIFGYEIGLYAFIACFMSYYFSGQRGIYASQKPDKKIKT